MSVVLSLEQARASSLGPALSDAALQAAIDEEEAWLARRIGPLQGERTQVFQLAGILPLSSSIKLKRPTDEVAVEHEGVTITDVQLRSDQRTLARLPEGTSYTGVLEVTYEPNDELEVRRALRELLSLQLSVVEAGGVQMEQMGAYMYQRGAGTANRTRASIVRSLLGAPSAGTLRVPSSVRHGLAGALGR